MKRRHVPQITNSQWFPAAFTQCIHEFMTWFVHKVGAAKPFVPVVEEGLSFANQIVVIEHRGGAGFETLDPHLDPSVARTSVEANNFSADRDGLYVSVNTFHQFSGAKAHEILKKVWERRQPIVVVEGNNDSLWQVFGMLVIVPLTVILTAPFVKPFRLTRIVGTYLIPVLPIVTFVDGFLALFKLYAPQDLDELTSGLKSSDYQWRSGKMDNGRGGKIIYLIGHPVHRAV